MSRTYGSYMLQPTKDEIRGWLAEARSSLRQERSLRRRAEYQLDVAMEFLGQMVAEGKITVPAHRLGGLVLQIAAEERAEREREVADKVLIEG